MRNIGALLLGFAALSVLAQQPPAPETEQAAAILRRIGGTPLAEEQQQQLRRALEGHDYKSAEEILVKAHDANPRSVELLTLAGTIFLLGKDPVNSAIALKKADKIRPLVPSDRFTMAMAFVGMGKEKWARAELEWLNTAEPTNSLYSYWLARLDYDERNYDAAVEKLRGVTAAEPGFMRAWDNLGLSLEGAGHLDQALASYQVAVRLNRAQNVPSAWPPLNMGTLLTKMGRLPDAEECLREAIRYDTKSAKAHYRLGLNLHQQNRDKEAIAELRQASELDSADPEPLYSLGRIYESQGDTKAAADVFRRFELLKKKQRGS